MGGTIRGAGFTVLDAARDYVRVAYARLVSPEYDLLLDGEQGERLEHVAPHLFECDPGGVIAHLALGGFPPGEVGLLIDGVGDFEVVRHHLRKHLTVLREVDKKTAFFRFYDPRVLRAFLPACTRDEVRQFFGPITEIHCQGSWAGSVNSYSHDAGVLRSRFVMVPEFFESRYGFSADRLQAFTNLLTQAVRNPGA